MDEPYVFKKSQTFYRFVKRALDVLLALILLLILAIPMIIAAIVTRCTSKGPAVFHQKRLGRDEVPFSLMKFRSMRVDAPQMGAEVFTEEDTSKYITKWGRFMRKTSIDELPQLLNILVGHMSFIGPRPCLDEKYDYELVNARRRKNPSGFAVKPGLTGLAIVKMHREHDPEQKATYDSEYARNYSFVQDIKIFFGTFVLIFTKDHETSK